ncbi:MAG: SMP-30/gluconolactonase/LRE family protein [Lentisphaeraceae bacterium]|nr:SMP-30/gluconolactonase/LRE family protein [Lentisphaeraceae bacterium]
MLKEFVLGLALFAAGCANDSTPKKAIGPVEGALDAKGYEGFVIPQENAEYPVQKFKDATISTLAKFPLFPEGPVYRPEDGSYFFAGNNALSRVTAEGEFRVLLPKAKASGGGTHILPDGSILIIGHTGLRRVFKDGRVAFLVDGKTVGKGNDITMDANGTIYFSVPGTGVYRLEAGLDKKAELIVDKRGLNGLEVDPKSEYLYINRGKAVVRHKILGVGKALGKEEHIYLFKNARELGGGDGCTFDAYGNYYVMHFKTGTLSVINPNTKSLVAQRTVGVAPATNVAFCGPQGRELMITAGAPKFKNCSILKFNLDIQGFCGHPGATEYSMIEFLDEEKVDSKQLND